MKDSYIMRSLKEHLVETKADTSDANAQVEMEKAVWDIGYPSLANKIAIVREVPKGVTSAIITSPSKLTASTMTAGDYGVQFVPMTYCTIPLSEPYGVRLGWTREYLEDTKWDAHGVNLREAGRCIEDKEFADMLTALDTGITSNTFAPAATLTWANIVEGWKMVAEDDYQADVLLVNPVEYAQMLLLDEFIDSAKLGKTGPIGTSSIHETLGLEVISSTKVTAGKLYFIDTKKCLAIAKRRARTVEEYRNPETNEYGIVATVRYGIKVVLADAACIGTKA